MIAAIEIVRDKGFAKPLSPMTVSDAAKRGLICRFVVFAGMETLGFAPLLVITREEGNEMVEILYESLRVVQDESRC